MTHSAQCNSIPSTEREAGFTLLELLVVLAILGLLAAVVAPKVIGYLGGARTKNATIQVKDIATSLELYRVDAGRYPNQQEGLAVLVKAPPGAVSWNGPYLGNPSGLVDPWTRPYRYAIPGKHGEFDVVSLGADDREGGSGEDKDVGSW